ncbi:MAG: peptide/nickel transport system ATP-binding protein [Solirubrobacteraceae bacterium]|nr:peptide/nickel transport system ATP-binding protein [Solirubrobacteraceae bacterium]
MSGLLEVEDLSVGFRTRRGVVQALSQASVTIGPGELLLVVGESGCGKTVLAHSLLRLLPRNVDVSGSIRLGGEDVLALKPEALRRMRGRRMALIPQSPGSSMNPVRKLGGQLLDAAQARGLTEAESRRVLRDLLAELGLDFELIAGRYVHQLSGGMQQRVVNALALVGEPDIVIADEPTSGLDADLVDTTAAQLQAISARGASLLVITHDLRLAQRLGGRLALLYASRVVEVGPTDTFFAAPAHPYGRELLRALPEREGKSIPGLSPELTLLPDHCAFADRCPDRFDRCADAIPNLYPAPTGSRARCFLHARS